MSRDHRPVFLNLLQIRLPLPGVVSIAHRISGLLLFLIIPVVLWLLMRASTSHEGYMEVRQLLQSPLIMPLLFLVFWAFWHHLLAGIRFLLLDVERGVDKPSSLKTAMIVLLLGVAAALISTAAWYFG